MDANPVWTVLWAIWGIYFFVFEGYAIHSKTKGDTLSEQTRHYFRVKGKVGSLAFLGLFGTFAAWFCAHIVGGNI